jgi:hypothetical protein
MGKHKYIETPEKMWELASTSQEATSIDSGVMFDLKFEKKHIGFSEEFNISVDRSFLIETNFDSKKKWTDFELKEFFRKWLK